MAFAPLITRLYGPEAFGQFGTFMAILAVATPIAALAYPVAIVLPPRDDRDALGLVRLSAILSFVVALLAAAGLWVGGDFVAGALGAESDGLSVLHPTSNAVRCLDADRAAVADPKKKHSA